MAHDLGTDQPNVYWDSLAALIPAGDQGASPSPQALDVFSGVPRTLNPLLTTPWPVKAANTATACRVDAGSATISGIGLAVRVTGGNLAVAVFRDNGSNAPGALVAQSGSKPTPAAGNQIIPLGSQVRVSAGDWIALVADSTTPTFSAVEVGIGGPLWLACSFPVTSLTFVSNPSGIAVDFREFALWGI